MAERNDSPRTPDKSGTSPGNSPRFPPGFMVAASPPRFVSFEQLMASADGVTNMALAHEIAVNNEFQLENVQPANKSINKQVRDIMHKAFWDSLEEKLACDPPDFSHALILLEEVKETLLSILLPQHQRIRTTILDVFDMELIQQKVENDAFDIHYYSNFVISILERLCAPIRDEHIANLKQIHEIVPLYKALFEGLDLMKMDMANFTIQQIRPYIQQQSVEYEKKKFQEFLATQESMGVDGLEFTRFWLNKAVEKVMEKTPITILNEAYLSLLDWEESRAYPETLLMDQERFHNLGLRTEYIILVSASLLVIYNITGETIAGISGFKEKLKKDMLAIVEHTAKDKLTSVMPEIFEHVRKELFECLQKHGYAPLSSSQEEALKTQLVDVAVRDHQVHQIIRRRVYGFLRDMMSWRQNTPQMQIPSGLSAVSEDLSQISGQFLRIISHNRSVFGLYYADIIGRMLNTEQQSERHERDSPMQAGS